MRDFPAIKNKTASSGIPEADRHSLIQILLDLNTSAPLDFLVFTPARVFIRIRYIALLYR